MTMPRLLRGEAIRALLVAVGFLACGRGQREPSGGGSSELTPSARSIEFRPRLDCDPSQFTAFEGFAGEFFGCLGSPFIVTVENAQLVQGVVDFSLEVRLSDAELARLDSYRATSPTAESFVFLCGTVLTSLNMGEGKLGSPLYFELPALPTAAIDRIKACLSIERSVEK